MLEDGGRVSAVKHVIFMRFGRVFAGKEREKERNGWGGKGRARFKGKNVQAGEMILILAVVVVVVTLVSKRLSSIMYHIVQHLNRAPNSTPNLHPYIRKYHDTGFIQHQHGLHHAPTRQHADETLLAHHEPYAQKGDGEEVVEQRQGLSEDAA